MKYNEGKKRGVSMKRSKAGTKNGEVATAYHYYYSQNFTTVDDISTIQQ